MSRKKINQYLDVQPNIVTAKTKTTIRLDLDEYKDINENYGEEIGISEIENVLEIPGFFTMEFPEEGDSISLFLTYNIYLNKNDTFEKTPDEIILTYQPGEMIFYANVKEEETNIRILKSLFENGVKYLGNKPDKLLTAIWQQMLSNSNVPWWHLEVIVSQLYGTYDPKTKEIVPLRLLDVPYSKKYIMNMHQSAHKMNQTLPVMYGYTNDAIRSMVSKKTRGKNSFFENIVAGDYDEMTKEYREAKKTKEKK